MKTYLIGARSRISGIKTLCKRDGETIEFDNRQEAEDYAEKERNNMGLNYHYWVIEEEAR